MRDGGVGLFQGCVALVCLLVCVVIVALLFYMGLVVFGEIVVTWREAIGG